MKKTFEAALNMAAFTLQYGKRKLSPQEYIKATKAYNEVANWFNFYGASLTDDNIKNYIANHSDKLLLIIPSSPSGKSILEKLNVNP